MVSADDVFVTYRIRNLSGVVTSHRVRFIRGVREGWRQTATLDEFLTQLRRSPWVRDVVCGGAS